ncbi:hypothetical protein GGE67_001476 [Rhizobium leucaenae]|uniref:Uncharacterized protein n=1 Tax=Rhizobium leucaenae TaxID=29450 RepID=A0A7W7EIS7_9HYPH|nr:hypothetical protein [Rhizobium leucaenae]MBB6300870.1 hypothetical protein [Rhizobium leucaenae]
MPPNGATAVEIRFSLPPTIADSRASATRKMQPIVSAIQDGDRGKLVELVAAGMKPPKEG